MACKHGNSSMYCGWCEDQAGLAEARAEIERLRADAARLDFLQRWVDDSKARGFKLDTFTFNCGETGQTVREQLDQQMAAGLRELPKY